MAEWSMAAVLKTVGRKSRGFESCSLRQKIKNRFRQKYLDEMFLNSYRPETNFSGEMAEWPKAIAC
jgi:hypothetical protein